MESNMKTVDDVPRPSYDEWVKEFKVSSQYVDQKLHQPQGYVCDMTIFTKRNRAIEYKEELVTG